MAADASEIFHGPWYKVATLRRDVREGRSFSPDEFATALEQVVSGTAPEDCRDPVPLFARTCFTRALKEHAGMVLGRLAGQTENTAPVLTLITQFGGGKTHTLTALYHLARGGEGASRFPGVAALLDRSGREGRARRPRRRLRRQRPGPGRRAGNAVDRHRPQLAGEAGAAALGPAARDTPPGTEALGRVFAAAQAPMLLLCDEVLNFVNRHRGMTEGFHAFIQNPTVATTGATRAVAVKSLPRSQVEMTDWDRQ